jgi:hypothetical protein
MDVVKDDKRKGTAFTPEIDCDQSAMALPPIMSAVLGLGLGLGLGLKSFILSTKTRYCHLCDNLKISNYLLIIMVSYLLL